MKGSLFINGRKCTCQALSESLCLKPKFSSIHSANRDMSEEHVAPLAWCEKNPPVNTLFLRVEISQTCSFRVVEFEWLCFEIFTDIHLSMRQHFKRLLRLWGITFVESSRCIRTKNQRKNIERKIVRALFFQRIPAGQYSMLMVAAVPSLLAHLLKSSSCPNYSKAVHKCHMASIMQSFFAVLWNT